MMAVKIISPFTNYVNCDYKHDARGSGENLYWYSRNIGQNKKAAFVRAVKKWSCEKSSMDRQGYKLRKGYYSSGKSGCASWGHYSQIVWKKTTKVCKYFYILYIYSLLSG